ncbi:hypothetical protein SAMN04515680_0175 [Leifsonia sp. 21MFCrub1.1]|nr:hypothetical protein SAMN04515680_0175 [Leifsonia sp. 21MFCrub1.1]
MTSAYSARRPAAPRVRSRWAGFPGPAHRHPLRRHGGDPVTTARDLLRSPHSAGVPLRISSVPVAAGKGGCGGRRAASPPETEGIPLLRPGTSSVSRTPPACRSGSPPFPVAVGKGGYGGRRAAFPRGTEGIPVQRRGNSSVSRALPECRFGSPPFLSRSGREVAGVAAPPSRGERRGPRYDGPGTPPFLALWRHAGSDLLRFLSRREGRLRGSPRRVPAGNGGDCRAAARELLRSPRAAGVRLRISSVPVAGGKGGCGGRRAASPRGTEGIAGRRTGSSSVSRALLASAADLLRSCRGREGRRRRVRGG